MFLFPFIFLWYVKAESPQALKMMEENHRAGRILRNEAAPDRSFPQRDRKRQRGSHTQGHSLP